VKKSKNQDFMGKTNFFLSTLPFSPIGSFSHMAACRISSKNIGKTNLIPVLNKTSPPAHTKLELDMLGVAGKLVKYIVHLSKSKIEKIISLHTSCLNNNQSVFGLKDFEGLTKYGSMCFLF
jgi:hypothetical protein